MKINFRNIRFRSKVGIAIIFFLSFFVSAQSPSIKLGVLKGISCAPCAYLIENKEKLSVQNMNFQIFDSPQSELPKFLRGELDICFLSTKDAAKVFEKSDKKIVFLAVAQNENAYLLTNDETYGSLEDLKGKTIICPQKTSSETTLFNHILTKKEILSDSTENSEISVKFDFSLPQANFANSLITGKSSYAIISEPYASVALLHSSKTVRAENLQKIYYELEESRSVPKMLLVARTDFVKTNRDLVRRFLDLYKNAVQWTNKNPSKAALLIEKHGLGLSFVIAKNSIPNSGLVFRESTIAKSDLEKYLTLMKRTLPTEEFYF